MFLHTHVKETNYLPWLRFETSHRYSHTKNVQTMKQMTVFKWSAVFFFKSLNTYLSIWRLKAQLPWETVGKTESREVMWLVHTCRQKHSFHWIKRIFFLVVILFYVLTIIFWEVSPPPLKRRIVESENEEFFMEFTKLLKTSKFVVFFCVCVCVCLFFIVVVKFIFSAYWATMEGCQFNKVIKKRHSALSWGDHFLLDTSCF